MIRVLMIDGNRSRAQALAMECLAQGIALRVAETLCEGVRCLIDTPVSLVLAEASLVRLARAEHVRLFDAVAPGVPAVLTVDAGTRVEDLVDLEVKGFHVVSRPFTLRDLLAKVDLPAKLELPRRGARARVEALCR
jgi:DNA-binding response OmpR family regulator